MKKIAVVTANLGNFEKNSNVFISGYNDYDTFKITDKDFPPRFCSMTPRLQARIVKMFMWQFVPGYEYYLWVDSSCMLMGKEAVDWFMEKLGDANIAVFKHPNRNSIQEEADYLKKRLAMKCPYITPRYTNELIDEQLKCVDGDDLLFASTAFIYRNSTPVHMAMKEWWYHTSRFHSIDQLSFYHSIRYADLSFNIIEESYLKIPYLKYVRK